MACRAKMYTNKICRDNQIHYTSLRLLLDHLVINIIRCTHDNNNKGKQVASMVATPLHMVLTAFP